MLSFGTTNQPVLSIFFNFLNLKGTSFAKFFTLLLGLQHLYWLHSEDADTCPPRVHTDISSSSCSLHSTICSQLPISAHKVSPKSGSSSGNSTACIGLRSLPQFWIITHFSLPSPTLHFAYGQIRASKHSHDLYDRDIFMSFTSMSDKFSLPNSHFSWCLQMRHFIQKQFPHFPNRRPEAKMDQFLSLNLQQKRLISVIYNKIACLSPVSTVPSKNAWEKDLGVDITEVQWRYILKLTHFSSICARHCVLQWKVLHRADFTNAKLAKRLPVTTQRVVAFTTLLARRAILFKWKHVSAPTNSSWMWNFTIPTVRETKVLTEGLFDIFP